jgi:hypothetical protein
MPGHGRDNLLHELELGGAHACVMTPDGVTASVLALRDGDLARRDEDPSPAPPGPPAPRWEPALVAALQRIGLDLEQSNTHCIEQALRLDKALRGAGSR